MSTDSGTGPGAGGSGTDRTCGEPALARRADVCRGAALLAAGFLALGFAAALLAAGLLAAAFRAVTLRFAVVAFFLTVRVARRVVVFARRVAPVARLLVAVAREAPRDDALRASCCTCLLRPSRRFNTLSTSACLALRLTRVSIWWTADITLFSPSLTVRSICLRRSGGTRFSAWRRAFLPAVTALPTNPERLDRDDARFLAAIDQPP